MRLSLLVISAFCFGISVARADICNRSHFVVEKIEAAVGKPCANIDAADLAAITTLNFWGNRGTLRADDLQGLSGLRDLALYYQDDATLLTPTLRDLEDLRSLFIYFRGYRSTVEAKAFEKLERLEHLYLGGTKITMPKEIFEDLSAIQRVELSWDRFQNLPTHVFEGLSSLRSLYLEVTDSVHRDPIPVDLFQGLSSIRKLEFATTTPEVPRELLHNLKTLEDIHVIFGFVESRPGPPVDLPEDLFKGLSDLSVIQVSVSNLRSVPEKLFNDQPHLQQLSLYGCELSTLPVKLFDHQNGLAELFLEENKFAPEEQSRIRAQLPQTYVLF